MEAILVMLITLALFLAIILLLAAKPKFAGKLTGAFIVLAAVGGLFFYGYGFAMTTQDIPLAIIRALLSVCGMYVGKMDLGAISAAPGMEQTWVQVLFWVVHLFALYATASAAITTVGAEALRKLRLWLARWGQLNIIYGVSDDTLLLGKRLLAMKRGSVVYVDKKPDAANTAAIAKAGCVLRSDDNALKADRKFMKSVGAHHKNRKISLYAMERDPGDNLQYAAGLLESLPKFGVEAEDTVLVLRGQENSAASELQVLGDRYGYGTVSVVQESSLAARILVQNYPPCDHIAFDGEGKATEDFEALVIGFGQVGQAVLRQLVMNGQFQGSTFRAAVFAPDCNAVNGYFSRSFAQVLQNYDIQFHNGDGRSEELYDHLTQRGEKIKYMAICAGSDKLNQEMAENIAVFCESSNLEIPIYLCTTHAVKKFRLDGRNSQRHNLYNPDILSMEKADKMAMLVNHHYQGDPDRGPKATWRDCDYFSRMSCRASADFIPAMLRMANTTAEKVGEKGWDLTPAQLENMSRAEHLRWCAFHYCMGFSPMGEEEYAERADTYIRQKAAGEKPLRIGKNMKNRTHACLISWEALVDLSAREEAITGKAVDYQAMDTENVLVIPKLLSALEKTKE